MIDWVHAYIESHFGSFLLVFFAIPFFSRTIINYWLLNKHDLETRPAANAPFFIWTTFKEIKPKYHWLAIISNLLALYFLLGFFMLLWPKIKESFQL